MLSLSVMNAAELEALKPSLTGADGKGKIAAAIEKFLRSHKMDSGADEDLIFLTGRALAKAGILEQLSAKFLAPRVVNIDLEKLGHFFSQSPDYFSRLSHLVEVGSRQPKKRQNKQKVRILYPALSAQRYATYYARLAQNEDVNVGRALEIAARAVKRNIDRKSQHGKFSRGPTVNTPEEGEAAAYFDADLAQAVMMEKSTKRVLERAGSMPNKRSKATRPRRQFQSVRQKKFSN